MNIKIGVVCGSFHRSEVERMLEWSTDEADRQGIEIEDVIWVPGAMEVPLALDRLLSRDDIEGAACLGIIEKGQTQHGLAMGHAVPKQQYSHYQVHIHYIHLNVIPRNYFQYLHMNILVQYNFAHILKMNYKNHYYNQYTHNTHTHLNCTHTHPHT